MIEGLKPYPEMRASDVRWIDRIPGHWKSQRIKTVLREFDRKTKTGEEPLLSLRMHAGLVDHHKSGGKAIPAEALVGYRLVEPGDFVMNRMRASTGLFGIAPCQGLVSPDYATFHPIGEVDPRFLVYLFKTPVMGALFRAESKGLGTGEAGFLRLYSDRFGAIRIPLPPVEEQRLIVRFLDWHGSLTAKLIRAKRRLIALLNEQKQAVIRQVVTIGLNPSAPLRLSGIEWLPQIPAHWGAGRGKALFKKLSRPVLPEHEVVTCFRDGQVTLRRNRRIEGFTNALKEVGYQGICRGDLVIHAMDAFCGAIGVSEADGKATPMYSVCAPIGSAQAKYYAFLLREMARVGWIAALATGIRERSSDFRFDMFARQKFPVPPEQEQRSIVELVERETKTLREEIQKQVSLCELLSEQRSSIIAAVVSGQLDIRAIASGLPDVDVADSICDEDPELADEIENMEDAA